MLPSFPLPTPRHLSLLIAHHVSHLLVLHEPSALQLGSLKNRTHFGDSRVIASPEENGGLMSGLRAEAAV
jgi:hypothetical protein